MSMPKIAGTRPSFLNSDRVLAKAVRPIVQFSRIEAAGGIVLVASAAVALVWANSPWSAGYEALWSTPVRFEIGTYAFREDLGHVVNDLLMAVFFFVVGMEIKRELVTGELRDRRAVALPVIAALGGMVVPATIYLAVNAGGDGSAGWGIPMATDIAFALGIVALLGRRVPGTVKVMLLTLAIVDDIGAIVVIAVFYTDRVEWNFVLAAAGCAALLAAMHRGRVLYMPVIGLVGLVLWVLVYESGIHATIAGVVMGLLTPARPAQPALETERIIDVLEGDDDLDAEEVRAAAFAIRDSVSACDRLIEALHPWTSYVIVPIFALANAGIALSRESIGSPSRVFVGVFVALVAGKLIGISAASWLAVRFGLARLPAGATWGHVVGVGALGGIGFTVSLFITGLAFDDPGLVVDAKVGVLLASITAAGVGAAIFASTSSTTSQPLVSEPRVRRGN